MEVTAHRKKIFVFDQDEFLVRIYASKLERAGYDPHYTGSIDELRGMMAAERPDVVLLELMVSGVDGFELIGEIKQATGAKIIALTKLSQPEDIARAMALGVDYYMIKTQVSFQDVMDKIAEMVR